MISSFHKRRLPSWRTLVGSFLAVVLGSIVGLGAPVAGAAPAGPAPYDDVPVLVCRLVVVESNAPLVDKGTQLNEAAFASELERWRTTGAGEVVVDEGFLLPVGGGVVSPHFDSTGGQLVVASGGGAKEAREPGLTLRLGTQSQGGRYQMAASVGAWNPPGKSLKEGLALTRFLRSPMEGRPPGILASLQGCLPGKEIEFRWESSLQQATAISGHLLPGAGARYYHSVFILPVAARPSLVAQPGQPERFDGGSIQAVEGRVPSTLFWRVINHVRPDLARPPAYSGRVLDLYWQEEKWELFAKTMQQAGGTFTVLPAMKLANSPAPQRLVGTAMVVSWKWQMPLPASAFTVEIEDPLSDGVSGLEPLARHCESHQGRWTIFARPIGEETRLMAVRSTFTGGAPVPAKAVAVTEEREAVVPMAPAAPAAPATPAAPAAPQTPAIRATALAAAQAPLELYAGEWSGTINGQPNSRVKMICNWNGAHTQLLRDTSVTLDPASQTPVYSSMVMKFDELAGKFHSQIVAKDADNPSVAEGSYDPATRTFIWTAENKLNGFTMVTRAVFPKDGVMEWTQTVTNKEGQLVSQGGGKNLRQRR